jgi:hypothetical protein
MINITVKGHEPWLTFLNALSNNNVMIIVNENATKEDSSSCTALKYDAFGLHKGTLATG